MNNTLFCLQDTIKFKEVMAMEDDELGELNSPNTHHFGKGIKRKSKLRLRVI